MEKVEFGSKEIPKSEKQRLVRALFDKVAGKYDLMNDAMTLGMHRLWKQAMIVRIDPQKNETLWDAAGGNADVALRFLRAEGSFATITDISSEMLQIGKKRIAKYGYWSKCQFIQDDMENSSLGDQCVHSIACAWGLRNATSITKAIAEFYRCLRFGGKLCVIEFAPMPEGSIAEIWCRKALPRLGRIIADDEDSYRYLAESIQRFPSPDKIQESLQQVGFRNNQYQLLAGGIAAIHWGWKI